MPKAYKFKVRAAQRWSGTNEGGVENTLPPHQKRDLCPHCVCGSKATKSCKGKKKLKKGEEKTDRGTSNPNNGYSTQRKFFLHPKKEGNSYSDYELDEPCKYYYAKWNKSDTRKKHSRISLLLSRPGKGRKIDSWVRITRAERRIIGDSHLMGRKCLLVSALGEGRNVLKIDSGCDCPTPWEQLMSRNYTHTWKGLTWPVFCLHLSHFPKKDTAVQEHAGERCLSSAIFILNIQNLIKDPFESWLLPAAFFPPSLQRERKEPEDQKGTNSEILEH